MGIFDKLANLINGTSGAPQEAGGDDREPLKGRPVSSHRLPGEEAIEKKDNLIRAVIGRLEQNFKGENHSMKGKSLYLHISDPIFRESLHTGDFMENLEMDIADEMGMKFDKIVVEDAPGPSDRDVVRLFDDAFMAIRSARMGRAVRHARITPVEGKGSTLQPQYVLDGDQVLNMPGRQYNIGIGSHPTVQGNLRRINHIAVDDNPEGTGYDQNKFVSRQHAAITYSKEAGFMLKAETGGTRVAGKRTHILRNNEMVELVNPLVQVPLKDGDIIVLSKNVYLLFEEIK